MGSFKLILLFMLSFSTLCGWSKTLEIKSSLLFAEDNFIVPKNWHHLDYQQDSALGLSSHKAHDKFEVELQNAKEVIVAIIDAGVDINHEALKNNIWINKDEIPNNKIDDDGNGYVDDYFGWNFLGNSKGSGKVEFKPKGDYHFHQGLKKFQLHFDSYSETRELKDLLKISQEFLTPKKRARLKELKKFISDKQIRATKLLADYKLDLKIFNHSLEILENFGLKRDDINLESIAQIQSDDKNVQNAVLALKNFLSRDIDQKFLLDQVELYKAQKQYQYNTKSNHREEIVQNSSSLLREKGYGNNDVIGPEPLHGTHVAGIIAAQRNDLSSAFGLVEKVKIMPIRAIPNGDERDKDIINAIYYAVDNGAKVINLSFGKYYSPHYKEVQQAMLYARGKGVILIHAAGNDYTNTDNKISFPSAFEDEKRVLDNLICVASSTPFDDETLVSGFSNYGRRTVDVLAPGSYIYSTLPNDNYASMSGTSVAAPMVSSISAVLLSLNPRLKPYQLRELILSGTTPFKHHFIMKPGLGQTTVSDIINVAGVVNLNSSIQLLFDYYRSQNIF